MTAMGADPSLIANARGLAKKLLRKGLPERWLHTQGVASRAAELAVTVPAADRPVLIAAAWLHDIGYAPGLQDTGFHPPDGGLYLRRAGWDDRLAALVAHHSGARFVPVERGYDSMMTEFDFEDGPVSDALTYADQTVGPHDHDHRAGEQPAVGAAETRQGVGPGVFGGRSAAPGDPGAGPAADGAQGLLRAPGWPRRSATPPRRPRSRAPVAGRPVRPAKPEVGSGRRAAG